MGTISESRWREIKQANQQVSVVGRSLLLGTGTGFFSGAGTGLAMTVMEPEQIAAVCTAVFLGWCMRPFDQGGPRSVPES